MILTGESVQLATLATIRIADRPVRRRRNVIAYSVRFVVASPPR